MSQAPSTPALPAPPRPVSRRASRRSWLEPRVRNWWLFGAVLLIIAVGYAAMRIPQVAEEQWLYKHGLRLKAKVERINDSVHTRVAAGERAIVDLSYEAPDGQRRELRGELIRQRMTAIVGRDVEIIVDPPTGRWTDRDQIAWAEAMLLEFILLPVALGLLIVAVFRRQAVLRLWRSAPASEAIVVDSRQSGFYPLSRVVRLTFPDDRSGRVYSVVLPQRQARLSPGDSLSVIGPPNRPAAALPAAAWIDSDPA